MSREAGPVPANSESGGDDRTRRRSGRMPERQFFRQLSPEGELLQRLLAEGEPAADAPPEHRAAMLGQRSIQWPQSGGATDSSASATSGSRGRPRSEASR